MLVNRILPPDPVSTAFAQVSPEFPWVLARPGEKRLGVDATKLASVILDNPFDEGQFVITDIALRTTNVLVTIVEGQELNARPWFPGTTEADSNLEAHPFRSQVLRLQVNRRLNPDCRSVYVVDAKVGERESTVQPGACGPAWHETWTIAACSRKEPVPIAIVPDANGLGQDPLLKDEVIGAVSSDANLLPSPPTFRTACHSVPSPSAPSTNHR